METTVFIIGITGENCAGKSALSKYIQRRFSNYSIQYINTREEILAIAKHVAEKEQRQIDLLDRPALSKFSNEYTERFGGDVYCKNFHSRAYVEKREILIIDSVRRVDEARYISNQNGLLISVTAQAEHRFEWAKKRGTLTDNIKTLEQFIDLDYKECAPEPWLLNLAETIKLANIHIENNVYSKEGFQESLEVRLAPFLLAKVPKKYSTGSGTLIAPGHGDC
ncbi:MAG: AAA family ATPase [bacterium]